MRRVRPAFARFERCTFDDTAIDGWKTEASEFIGCRFAGALGTVTFYGKLIGSAGKAIDGGSKMAPRIWCAPLPSAIFSMYRM